jgi:hypothetical protein
MRNMLIALAAVATLIVGGNVMAATPNSHEAPSILVESPSDAVASDHATQTARAQTMVNTQMEAPVVYDGPADQSEPQAIPNHSGHRHQTYHRAQPPKKKNVFEQLMDLERRKNAWLKKTFLGR